MDRLSICLSALSVGLLVSMTPAWASPSHALNVREFGARGDDAAKDTAAFQKGLDAVGRQVGGGVLDVPPGIYLIGSIVLPTHVTLNVQAGATVLGSDDPADYPLTTVRWEGRLQTIRRALIVADHADGIALIGDGLIQGSRTVGNEPDPNGPVLFEPVSCRGVRVTGLTVKNFGGPVLHPMLCDDVIVTHVSLESRGENSDGLVVDSCRHVRVAGCSFQGGGAALRIQADGGGPAEDIIADGIIVVGDVLVIRALDTSSPIRDIRLSHIKAKAATLVEVVGLPQSPVDGLMLTHIAGTCTQAITLRNATHVTLDHIAAKGYVGPRLTTENVTGMGLDDAVPYKVK